MRIVASGAAHFTRCNGCHTRRTSKVKHPEQRQPCYFEPYTTGECTSPKDLDEDNGENDKETESASENEEAVDMSESCKVIG